jgi:MFS family permease
MKGIGGYSGWRWIFIIEGALIVVIAIMPFWQVHDFPDEAKFFSEADRDRVLRHLAQDKQSSARHEEFKMAYVWSALQDWKTYVSMLIYMGPLMPLYSISLFLPTIIANLSFTEKTQIIRNQLLSVPPYAGGTVVTIAVGFTMLIASTNPGVQYASTFFAVIGIYATIPTTIAWVANNVEGVYQRGIVLGIMIGWGNLNGIVSSNMWSDALRFIAGHATSIAYLTVCLFGGSVLFHVLLSRENAKRMAGERNYLVRERRSRKWICWGISGRTFIILCS